MIYAMIQGYAYTIYGGYGGGRDREERRVNTVASSASAARRFM